MGGLGLVSKLTDSVILPQTFFLLPTLTWRECTDTSVAVGKE